MSRPAPDPPAEDDPFLGDPGSPGCLAFAVAAVAAALGASILPGWSQLFPLAFVAAFVVASFHVAVLALPIHFALASRHRINFGMILAAAILIGALPATFIAALSGAWRDLPEIAATFGFCGACGGLAFWTVVKLEPR